MDLNAIHNLILFYLRKEQGGVLSHEEIDAVLNRAQYDLFEEIKPAYGVNQQTHDYLLPFKKNQTLTNGTTAAGVITLASDYYHLCAVSLVVVDDNSRTRYIGLEMVNDDEVDARRDSALIPLDTLNPIGVYTQDKKIQVYPASPVAGTLRYLRKPTECSFVYTQAGRLFTYNSVSSVQLEWNEPAINKIINKSLQFLGLNVVDVNAIQFAQAKEGQGGI